MPRHKHTGTNEWVVHSWLSPGMRERPPGERYGSSKSMSFDGDILRSYNANLGVKVGDVVLLNDSYYSGTTTRHLGIARFALNHMDTLCVGLRQPGDAERDLVVMAADMERRYASGRSPNSANRKLRALKALLREWRRRPEEFAEKIPGFRISPKAVSYITAMLREDWAKRAMAAEPDEYAESRARLAISRRDLVTSSPRERAEIREKELEAARERNRGMIRDAIRSFRNTGRMTYQMRNALDQFGFRVMLAVVGDRVVTSKGVGVPVADVLAVYRKWDAGEDVTGMPCGYYRVDSVNSSTIRLGCHRIRFKEVRKVIAPLARKMEAVA